MFDEENLISLAIFLSFCLSVHNTYVQPWFWEERIFLWTNHKFSHFFAKFSHNFFSEFSHYFYREISSLFNHFPYWFDRWLKCTVVKLANLSLKEVSIKITSIVPLRRNFNQSSLHWWKKCKLFFFAKIHWFINLLKKKENFWLADNSMKDIYVNWYSQRSFVGWFIGRLDGYLIGWLID